MWDIFINIYNEISYNNYFHLHILAKSAPKVKRHSSGSYENSKDMDTLDKEDNQSNQSLAENAKSSDPAESLKNTIIYYCAIQGCRSVEEFECLNKIGWLPFL